MFELNNRVKREMKGPNDRCQNTELLKEQKEKNVMLKC